MACKVCQPSIFTLVLLKTGSAGRLQCTTVKAELACQIAAWHAEREGVEPTSFGAVASKEMAFLNWTVCGAIAL